MQYMIARNLPLKGYLVLVMILAEVWAIHVLVPVWGMLVSWPDLLFFVFTLLAAPVLAFLFGDKTRTLNPMKTRRELRELFCSDVFVWEGHHVDVPFVGLIFFSPNTG